MLVNTKHFGEIELQEDKIIHFEHGILGFEDYKKYTLLFDVEEGDAPVISWMQSVDEPSLALPVISPFMIKEDYNPIIDDEALTTLGEISDENALILVIISVPKEISNMTANLKAPIIINSNTNVACQIVVQNSDYEIKHHFYSALQDIKMKKGANLC